MNRRLSAIAACIESGPGFVDVGTDHGYLPAYFAQSGYPGRILASDIKPEPLNAARRTASQAGVEERIEFLLCDGLALCSPDAVDTIVIAGMGGDAIVKILDEAEWCMDGRYRLILQPMTKAEVVRYWLAYNGFEIKAELLAEEGGSLYQILVARFGGETRLNDAELFAGKRSLARDRELYEKQLTLLHERFEKAIRGMCAGETLTEHRVRLYREILSELEQMGKQL